MRKIMRIGTVAICGRQESVYITVEAKETKNGPALSFTGVEGPRFGGYNRGSFGQIVMHLDPDEICPAPGWTPKMIAELLYLWQTWHTNDMRAGCVHQRHLGWTWDDHALAPCPECGYRLGSEWLFEPVPPDVLTRIGQFPDTDKPHPWMPEAETEWTY